jgi:hypothetical protein
MPSRVNVPDAFTTKIVSVYKIPDDGMASPTKRVNCCMLNCGINRIIDFIKKFCNR